MTLPSSLIPNPFTKKYENSAIADTPLHIKWSGKRVVRSETDPYKDPGISFIGDPGLTDHSQAAETDVNNVMKRYLQTGVLPGVNSEALYQDMTDAPTYHEAMNTVIHAQQQFESLDAFVRAKFHNDPAQFLEFASDPKNSSALVEMGLASHRPQNPIEALTAEIRTANKASKPKPSPADPASDE